MSFSDNSPDWSDFLERPGPALEIFSPAAEIATLLQRYRVDIDKAQKQTEQVHRKNMEELAQQAVYVVQLEIVLEQYKSQLEQASLSKIYRSFRIVKNQMLDALRNAGLTIVVPLDKSFDEVSAHVNVIGWKHAPNYQEEIVIEVLEPIVFYHDTLLRLGTVVMGAPLEQAPESAKSTIDNEQVKEERG